MFCQTVKFRDVNMAIGWSTRVRTGVMVLCSRGFSVSVEMDLVGRRCLDIESSVL